MTYTVHVPVPAAQTNDSAYQIYPQTSTNNTTHADAAVVRAQGSNHYTIHVPEDNDADSL